MSNTIADDTKNSVESELQFATLPIRAFAPPDDLTFEYGPHPNDASRNAVFLRNKNDSRGVIASVQVDGNSDLQVETPNRIAKRYRWPLQFEVRIPPGTWVLVGLERFRVIRSISYSPAAPIIVDENVLQKFSLLGAYYHDLPLPPPVEQAEDWVWVYSATIVNHEYYRFNDFMVNLHPNKQIEVIALPLPSGTGFAAAVIPGYQLQVTAAPETQRFRIDNIKFV